MFKVNVEYTREETSFSTILFSSSPTFDSTKGSNGNFAIYFLSYVNIGLMLGQLQALSLWNAGNGWMRILSNVVNDRLIAIGKHSLHSIVA